VRLMTGALFAERRVFIMEMHSNKNAEDG